MPVIVVESMSNATGCNENNEDDRACVHDKWHAL